MKQFTLVQDTREQNPWAAPVRTLRRSLKFGDYSAQGLEQQVAVERKSASDLVSSLSSREAFHRLAREFVGAKEAGILLILVVECSMQSAQDALCRYYPSMSLSRRIARFALVTGSTPLFLGSRLAAMKFTLNLLETALKERELRPPSTFAKT